MKRETIDPGEGGEDRGYTNHQRCRACGPSLQANEDSLSDEAHGLCCQPLEVGLASKARSTTGRWRSRKNEGRGEVPGGQLAVTTGRIDRKRRKRRFWVLLVLSAIPTGFVVLLAFLMRYYEFPEIVMGVLFFAVVIPAALICEKLGVGEFRILGGSTIPDWLFYSVMILLVYLYSLALVALGRGVVWLVGRAFLKVRGLPEHLDKLDTGKPLARRMSD